MNEEKVDPEVEAFLFQLQKSKLTSWVENPYHGNGNLYFDSEGNPTLVLKNLKKLVLQAVCDLLPMSEVCGIYIVGSFARAATGENSDLDILVATKSLDWAKGSKASEEYINLMIRVNPHERAETMRQAVVENNFSGNLEHGKAKFVDVMVRSFGHANAFDLVNERWVSLPDNFQ